MAENKSHTPDHTRSMDISWAHFFRLFPTAVIQLAHPNKKIKAIAEINSIFKAIETSTDSAWLMEVDGEQRIVLYEEMTRWDNRILEELFFRKMLWWREKKIHPIGLIIVPIGGQVKSKTATHCISGSEQSFMLDQNEILVLSDAEFIKFKKKPGQDVSLEMLSIFAKDESVELAAKRIERLTELPGDMEIKRTAQFIAYFWAKYRFGNNKIFNDLWKRIKSMIETLDVYKEIVGRGRQEGEALGIAKGKAEAIITYLQKLHSVIIPEHVKDKIYAQTDIDILNEWLDLTLDVPDFESFRQRTGL